MPCQVQNKRTPAGRRGIENRAAPHRAERCLAPACVSPQAAGKRKRRAGDRAPARQRRRAVMSMAEGKMRGLPGATILQIVPAMVESGAARAAVDVAIALLRSGARVIV